MHGRESSINTGGIILTPATIFAVYTLCHVSAILLSNLNMKIKTKLH